MPGSHKSAELRRIIRAAGARLWYLPPCSPDLNPIKHWLRAAQKRTGDELWRDIGGLVSTIQAQNEATPSPTQNTLSNRETL